MPQTVGLLLLAPFDAAGIAGLGTLGASTIELGALGSISIASAVGSAAIIGAPIGLQVCLNRSEAS